MSDKEKIQGLFRELFPDIKIHVLHPYESLASLGTALPDAYEKIAFLTMELQHSREALNPLHLALLRRIPLADEAVNVLVYNPARVNPDIAHDEVFILAHEAAHAGIHQLIDVDGAIRRGFPDCHRMRTYGKDMDAAQTEYDALGDVALRSRKGLSDPQMERMQVLRGTLRGLENLWAQWSRFGRSFTDEQKLACFRRLGANISLEDLPAFEERVTDLFASVEAARRTPGYTPERIFKERADAAVITLLNNMPLSAKNAATRQSLLEHYSVDVLDAAAKEPDFCKSPGGEDLKSYDLLKACIVFAGKHFKPMPKLEDEFRQAEEKGLHDKRFNTALPFWAVGQWLRTLAFSQKIASGRLTAGGFAAAKVMSTTPASDPVHKMASRLVLAHFRECERREEVFRYNPPARAVNSLLKSYFSKLLDREKGHG
jgi:hypothetical protein